MYLPEGETKEEVELWCVQHDDGDVVEHLEEHDMEDALRLHAQNVRKRQKRTQPQRQEEARGGKDGNTAAGGASRSGSKRGRSGPEATAARREKCVTRYKMDPFEVLGLDPSECTA